MFLKNIHSFLFIISLVQMIALSHTLIYKRTDVYIISYVISILHMLGAMMTYHYNICIVSISFFIIIIFIENVTENKKMCDPGLKQNINMYSRSLRVQPVHPTCYIICRPSITCILNSLIIK
jgi:hypothetical protein